MNDECFEEFREKEIKRLTDSLGSEEPVKGILTDDEILKYAGNSKEASRIRLKRGENDFRDKFEIHGDTIGSMWFITMSPWGLFLGMMGFWSNNLTCKILFLALISFLIGYTLYYLYLKDYSEPEYNIIKEIIIFIEKIFRIIVKNKRRAYNETFEDPNLSNNDDLLLLFESKEKIAREMIERKFQLLNWQILNLIQF